MLFIELKTAFDSVNREVELDTLRSRSRDEGDSQILYLIKSLHQRSILHVRRVVFLQKRCVASLRESSYLQSNIMRFYSPVLHLIRNAKVANFKFMQIIRFSQYSQTKTGKLKMRIKNLEMTKKIKPCDTGQTSRSLGIKGAEVDL